jgi:hypothetical protein
MHAARGCRRFVGAFLVDGGVGDGLGAHARFLGVGSAEA